MVTGNQSNIEGGDDGKDLVWILAIKIVAGIYQRNGCKKFLGRMKVGIYFFEEGCYYAALMRPKKVETRLQLHLGRWPSGC